MSTVRPVTPISSPWPARRQTLGRSSGSTWKSRGTWTRHWRSSGPCAPSSRAWGCACRRIFAARPRTWTPCLRSSPRSDSCRVPTTTARPVFGTHDLGLVKRIRERATALHVAPGGYEVHMLYGIRSAEQRALARDGVRVRVLISYGTHWFPWYMRRLAERPANVWFVVRNLV